LVRIPIPELTSERRVELAKLAHKYAEQGRVAVRNVRRDGMEALKKAEKDHKISQDEHRHKSDEVQKLTDRYVKQVDEMLTHKEKEIKRVGGRRPLCPPHRTRHPGPRTSPSSWMATGAGQRRARCRALPAIAAAPMPFAAWCAARASSASRS